MGRGEVPKKKKQKKIIARPKKEKNIIGYLKDQSANLYKKLLIKIKNNKDKLLHYYYLFLTPLCFLLLIYSLFFFSVANNFNYKKTAISVGRNSTANDILFTLKKEGVIRNKFYAKVVLLTTGWHRGVRAGKYTFSPSMSLRKILKSLTGAYGVSQDDLTVVVIPEGYSFQEIITVLTEKKIIDKQDFFNYILELDTLYWQTKYKFLINDNLDSFSFFEGYFYPDTYRFAEGLAPEALIKAFLDNFKINILPELLQNTNDLNSHQLITLASIIEKEAVLSSERGLVAGVFYNRLKRRMYLQSCPTVKFALGAPHKKFLLYKDLEVVSPYNTYRHPGLPPGPICSPGKAAVLAALNPEKTDYLYFVAKGDGSHLFSRTYEEHLSYQNMVNSGRVY